MELVLAFVTGAMYAAGLFMMMRRSIFNMILGLILFGHASNLLIFTLGGLKRGHPPFVAADAAAATAGLPDPLPQALILTAIVIGFGVNAFAVVLIRRSHDATGADDLNQLKSTDCSD